MPNSLFAPLFAYAGGRDLHLAPRSMDALAECRPQVEILVARILRRGKSDPDVQDCTHETLRRALEQRERINDSAPLLPWLLGIARHVALDALRAEYRRRARTAPRGSSDDVTTQLVDERAGPELLVSTHERARQVQKALAALPEVQREALLALHLDGLGYKEIAERFSVPVGTVGTWILRGRQNLIEFLQKPARGEPISEDE